MISVRLRKLVHLGLGLGALALPFLTWWQSVDAGGPGGRGLRADAARHAREPARPRPRSAAARRGDVLRARRAAPAGDVPDPPDLVAVGWGILAGGDGAATFAGRAWGGPRWAWNRDKTLVGSAAFVLAGATMGFLLAWAVRGSVVMAGGPPSLVFLAAAALGAALLAAIIETLPIRLDDNLSVSASAALVLWCATLVSPETSAAAWPILIRTAPIGVLLNTLVAVAVWRAGGVSASGAIAGAILGALIYAGTGWRGWVMLVVALRRGLEHVEDRAGAQARARHRGSPRRPPRRRERDRQLRPRRGGGAGGAVLLVSRRCAARADRGAHGRRQRHGRQ